MSTEDAVDVRLIGRFAVLRGGVALPDGDIGSKKGRTLLKLLAVNRDHMVSTDRIAEAVWESSPPARPEESVAVLVSRLRRTFGAERIAGGRSGYRFVTSAATRVDVDQAAALTAEAEARLGAAEPALARVAADGALSILDAGGLLDAEPGSDWLDVARADLERLRARARRAAGAAALAVGDHDRAAAIAHAAIADDPLDEGAHRALMRALRAGGDAAAAIAAFERLRSALADELGVDPSPETRALHLAILRAEEPDADTTHAHPHAASPVPIPGFVGRDAEMSALHERWTRATVGQASLVAIAGEAGIGKTRLAGEGANLAQATGGLVVRARCYEAERSLYLQPFVEAVRSVAVVTDPDVLRELAGEHAGTLADLVPEVARALRPHGYTPATPEREHRRAFEAMTSFVRQLARRKPLLLLLDDLHNAGASSVELLHFLARRLMAEPLLVLATVRSEEGQEALDQLSDVAEILELGPLSGRAVDELARAMGAPEVGQRVLALTRGHTLFAVEAIRALREGADGAETDGAAGLENIVPDTLRAAVLARLRRAGRPVEDLLRAACILGPAFDLHTTAGLMEAPPEDVATWAEAALQARLIVDAGSGYEFANDLVQEVLYRTTPTPTRILRHRRAAELMAGNPEAVATHAAAGGAWDLALGAWQEAAALAARRYANRDAELLLDRALVAAERLRDPAGEAAVRLERSRARFALRDLDGARDDVDRALALARASGARRVEMGCLAELGGDLAISLGLPARDCLPHLEAALEIARELDDRAAETSVLGRLSVVHGNCARFDLAVQTADLALARARDAGNERALALALDGRKMAAAHLGEFAVLGPCVRELERLLRRSDDIFLLQWTIFESAFEPMARARSDEAVARIGEAMVLCRQINDRPVESWFLSHLAWIERARGNHARSVEHGEAALAIAEEAGHSWWIPFAETMLAWTLVELDRPGEAVRHLRRGLEVAERGGAVLYLAQCQAHLAWAMWAAGDRAAALAEAERAEASLDAVRTPPGTAFLHGAHAYAAVARVALEAGRPERAERLLDPILHAAAEADWKEALAEAALLTGRAVVARGDLSNGSERLRLALSVAGDAGLARVAAEATVALEGLKGVRGARRSGPPPAPRRRSPPADSQPA